MNDKITCPNCRERLAECPHNEAGYPLARELFEVGNAARSEMGHAMYHAKSGRVALCSAKRRDVYPTAS